MFPAKIYVGQIAVVFGIVVTSTWGATQWAAHALGYQDGLGSPCFTLSGYPVYLPWRLFEWWFAAIYACNPRVRRPLCRKVRKQVSAAWCNPVSVRLNS
jgi:type IV secretory pathway TraG/TraD family ATPase VirD4